jgi:hypothetical protein
VPAGTIGPFAVFTNTRAWGPFSASGRTKASDLRVRVLRSSPWTPTETVEVTSALPVTIVRSVADIPGWKASGYHDGRTRAIAIQRDGLVQSFSVAKGTTLVSFTYQAPGLKAGLAASASGVVVMLLLALGALVAAKRRSLRPNR